LIRSAFQHLAHGFPPETTSIGLSVPPFLTDSQLAPFFAAAHHEKLTIRDIAHSPSALAPPDIDLCRIQSEYIACNQRHVLTLDLAMDRLTASSLRVHSNMDIYQAMEFQISHTLGRSQSEGEDWQRQATAFIGAFADDNNRRPDEMTDVYLVGPEANDPSLLAAVRASQLAHAFERSPTLASPHSAEALGMARLTKQVMESQSSDCIEEERCEKLRRRADKISKDWPGVDTVMLDGEENPRSEL
jgi:hypothetical protein